MSKYRLINSLIEEARAKGLASENAVRLKIMGGTGVRAAIEAPIIPVVVSYSAPAAMNGLWLNPATRSLNAFIDDAWNPIVYTTRGKLFEQEFIALPSSSGYFSHEPMQTTAELLALDTSTLVDKTLVYVEDERTLYAYDKESQEAGSDKVLVPDSGAGRWFLIASPTVAGYLDGGTF